jgi:hypothetical protein
MHNIFPPDLQFKFLPAISFKSKKERLTILTRGLEELQKGNVPESVLERGDKYRKEIETAFYPNVAVRFISETVGHGVFAEETLQKRSHFT